MKKTLAILVASPMLCSYAWGGTVQQRLPDTPYLDGGQVRASGNEQKFGAVRGMGQDMPLYKALAAIIPRGYTVRTVGVERWLLDEPVSWAGGSNWTEVLSEAISPYPELVVDIATGSKVVILRQQYSSSDGSPMQYAAAPVLSRTIAGADRYTAAPPPAPAAAPIYAPPEPPVASYGAKRAPAPQAAVVEKPQKQDIAAYMDMPRPAAKVERIAAKKSRKEAVAYAAPEPDLPSPKFEYALAEKSNKAEVALVSHTAKQPKWEAPVVEKEPKEEFIEVAEAPKPAPKAEAAVVEKKVKPEVAAYAEEAKPAPKAEPAIAEKAPKEEVIVLAEASKPAPKAKPAVVEKAAKEEVIVVAEAPKEVPKAEAAPAEKPLKPEVAAFAEEAKQTAKAEPAAVETTSNPVVAVLAEAPKSAAADSTPKVEAFPVAEAPKPTWVIATGDKTLKYVMTRWAETAGWQLSWELTVDYPVEAHASIDGTFQEAVEAVAKSMERAEIPMKAIFYKGNKVLRIVAKGVE